MKVRQYFLIIVMFSLLGFNAIADTCSSPTTCSNSSCTNTSGVGLACSETNPDCNCFDTGYTYWNGDTCVPNITFNSGTYSCIVQYTCDTNMHLTTTPY